MSMNSAVLGGYFLEEAVAYLVRNAGFELLMKASHDPADLADRASGLVVRGRGGYHQVDVLGRLRWIPAFTYPLRLIVEAKHRGHTTDQATVERAISILADVNQNFVSIGPKRKFRKRYQYVFAIFSTSGFTGGASKMALAHQISLIDLSGPEFSALRQPVDDVARAVCGAYASLQRVGPGTEAETHLGVKSLRNGLRRRLYPEQPDTEPVVGQLRQVADAALAQFAGELRGLGELFIAMSDGPFMLVLKADDPERFAQYAATHPNHDVTLKWNSVSKGESWEIRPLPDYDAYRLTFKLPKILSKWIYRNEAGSRRRALNVKRAYFSSITVHRYLAGVPQIYTLRYEAPEPQEAGWTPPISSPAGTR